MNEREELLSVIVPIYNSGEYIGRCIESLLNQTYRKLEIILVDDGSTDASGAICDRYAKQDNRIQVFHKENEGLVETRKYGLRKASGEYVAFVDSDDWIESSMYEEMLSGNDGKSADIIVSGLTMEDDGIISYEMDTVPEGYYTRNEVIEKILPVMMHDAGHNRRGITGAIWNKIFSKSLLETCLYSLDSNLTYGEDAAVVYPAIARASGVIVKKKSWYHYMIHPGSMASSYGMESFQKILFLKRELQKAFETLGIWRQMQYQVDEYLYVFLWNAVYKNYDLDMVRVPFLFPYELVPKGSRIILYGAGIMGQSYWKCLQRGTYAQMVSWVDKNYQERKKSGLPVEALGDALYKGYDFIVVAVNKRGIAEEIKKELLEYGVKEDKIIWKPRHSQ